MTYESAQHSFMKHIKHGKNCPCTIQSSKARTNILLPHLRKALRGKRTNIADKLKHAPNCVIKYAADCAGALLKNHIQLPPENYKKLRKHKNSLLFLAKKGPSLRKKRELLIQQNGAGIGIILRPLINLAVTGLITALATKK